MPASWQMPTARIKIFTDEVRTIVRVCHRCCEPFVHDRRQFGSDSSDPHHGPLLPAKSGDHVPASYFHHHHTSATFPLGLIAAVAQG